MRSAHIRDDDNKSADGHPVCASDYLRELAVTIDVELKIQTLKQLHGRPEARVPTDALRDYFASFDIHLNFTDGAELSADPTDFEDTIDDFLAENAPAPDSTGAASLLVTDLGYRGLSANGMLLDVKRRGACAVFIQSAGFKHSDAEGRFEIYAHEIGHLLNLSHDDPDVADPWAMNSWGQRSEVTDRKARWNSAIDGGVADYANRLRIFFDSGARSPIGLPMSPSCCSALLTSPAAKIKPWMSVFSGDDSLDATEPVSNLFEFGFEVHGDQWGVGYPLDVTMTLRLKPGVVGREIPHLLDRASGELQLQLERPDGHLRLLQSQHHVCTSLRRWMRPRQTVRRDESLIVDKEGLVFNTPGRYRVRACIPQLQVYSSWITIDVAEVNKAFAPMALQEFLRQGLPRAAETGWRYINNILSSGQLAPQLAADIASRAAANGMRDFETLRTFRKTASPAVAQRDALRRIARLRHSLHPDTRALHGLIDNAEHLFATADTQHPTLDYLAHLRRGIFMKKRGEK